MPFLSLPQAISPKAWLMAGVAWLLMAMLVLALQLSSEITRQQHDFQRNSEALYELIGQRLDQNEAVLGGLEALLTTFKKLEFDDIRGYSREMLGRYPHIYTIELQPRVELADVAYFERVTSAKMKQAFHIKDFIVGDEHHSRPAAQRAVYYPITFMEPPTAAAAAALGLDVYADPKFKKAINQTLTTGKPSVSVPFDLLEGGRGYLIFKAIFSAPPPIANHPARLRQATHIVSMLIHTNQFLQQEALPSVSAAMTMALYHRSCAKGDPRGLIDSIGSITPSTPWQFLFPRFHFSKALASVSQPFVFETQRQLDWEIVRPMPTLLALSSTLLIALLAAVLLQQRRNNQLTLSNTKDVLFREKEKALVTLNAITDAVITLDADGVIEYTNQAAEQSIQRTLADVKGKRISEVLVFQSELSQSVLSDPFITCIHQRRSVNLADDSVMLTVDGRCVLIEGSVAPLFDSAQALIGAVVAFRDMGPLRKRVFESMDAREKKLRQHQAELAHVARLNTMGEMASGIAHEISQPLTAILSYNQACIRMLQDKPVDTKEIIRIMDSAATQSQRAGEIIKRLRAFVSKQATQSEPVDLNQVIQNVLTLSEHELRDHQIKVTTNLALTLPLVIADGIQLEQVVLNLVRNGIDAMDATPLAERAICITTRAEQSRVALSVRDYGHGISNYVQDQLFHPFFTTKADGMGLGLTISYSIVEAYGGTLLARSCDAGGAEFSFSLPASSASSAPNAELDLS